MAKLGVGGILITKYLLSIFLELLLSLFFCFRKNICEIYRMDRIRGDSTLFSSLASMYMINLNISYKFLDVEKWTMLKWTICQIIMHSFHRNKFDIRNRSRCRSALTIMIFAYIIEHVVVSSRSIHFLDKVTNFQSLLSRYFAILRYYSKWLYFTSCT